MNLTAEQVSSAIQQNGITRIDHHSCGACNYMTAFVINGDKVEFDPGCHCCGGEFRLSSFDAIADFYNTQDNPDVRARIGRSMGLQV